MDCCVSVNTQSVENIEDLGRHQVVAPDAPEHIGERVVDGGVCSGALGDNSGHTFGELSGLDQGRVCIVDEVFLGVRCQNCQGAIDVLQVIEILTGHPG